MSIQQIMDWVQDDPQGRAAEGLKRLESLGIKDDDPDVDSEYRDAGEVLAMMADAADFVASHQPDGGLPATS